MTARARAATVIGLGAAAYLGFYLFGLVMGVYSPGEVPYLTIPALVVAALFALFSVRRRLASPSSADESLVRTSRHLRETRRF